MTTIPVQLKTLNVTSDAFDRHASAVRSLVHFDPTSFVNQVVPHRSSESGDSSASTNQITNFEYANGKFYGLSIAGSGNAQRLYSRENADVDDATWDAPTTTSATQVPDGLCFMDYKKEGKLYWSLAAGNLASYTYASSSYTANAEGINATGQAIVHSDDNIMYVPLAQNIASNNNGSWNTAVFSNPLPSNASVVSICEYGKFLAIGCAPTNGYGKSVIYLWDKTSVTWSEIIDLGYRNLKILEQVEGELVAISYSTSNTFGARITIQSYAGGQPKIVSELISSTAYTIGDLSGIKQKYGVRLYFLLTITLNGSTLQGVWRVSRPAQGQPFTVSLDYLPNNDTGLTAGLLNGFYLWGDYMFISYISSSVYGMSKTDDTATYTATSYVETCINPRMSDGDFLQKKQLKKFGVSLSPLSSGQQCLVKYKVDGGTWKTIFTKTFTTPTAETADYTSNRAVAGQFDQGNQYEFRIESTGGAIPVAYSYEYTLVAQPQ